MHVFTFLSFLALSCFGVASVASHEDVCSQIPVQGKGKPYGCTDDYRPVCGTNGVTYTNLCELCAARRETGKDIRVKHEGECKKQDECSKYPAPPKGQTAGCTYELAPVCGSDGVTYPNLCTFCVTKRESEKDITIKHQGECKRKDVCSKFQEPPKGKDAPCTTEYAPVCGSDGKTYSNLCDFCQARKESGKDLKIKHEGKCKEKDVCSTFQEPPKGKDAPCTAEYAPVCGSDGKTYSNLCDFCQARRESGKYLKIKHEGECKEKDVCSRIPEPPKGKPAICTEEYAPICGSDGKTYSNLCDFCKARRESGGKITIKHQGVCKKKDECSRFTKPMVACTKEYAPVCGTNGVTYDNLCMLCFERQKTGENICVAHQGKCKEKDECSIFPEVPKGHPPGCTREYQPVCGSDGVTYGNKCLYCCAKREKGGNLSIDHEGECKLKDECSQFPVPPKGKPILCPAERVPVCASNGQTYGSLCFFCDAKREQGGDLTILHQGECDQKNKKE